LGRHVLAVGDDGRASKSKPASSFTAGKCASFSAISVRR
jgi:hypothetical protein